MSLAYHIPRSKERQYLGMPRDLPTLRLGDWVPV